MLVLYLTLYKLIVTGILGANMWGDSSISEVVVDYRRVEMLIRRYGCFKKANMADTPDDQLHQAILCHVNDDCVPNSRQTG